MTPVANHNNEAYWGYADERQFISVYDICSGYNVSSIERYSDDALKGLN